MNGGRIILRIAFYIAATMFIIGMQVPVYAIWNIPADSSSTPVPSIQPLTPSWIKTTQAESPVVPINPPSSDSKLIVVREGWTDKTQPPAQPAFIKSEEDMKILTPPVFIDPRNPYATAVPEPGSIAGLSAGLLGLIFQVRRARRRS